MGELTVEVGDGRTVGVADEDVAIGTPVLWCHGGPGSRLEPDWLRPAARAAGLRIVGVDRPGYGASPPRPGRTIADVVTDLLVVADHLGLDRFVTVGLSTGGAYALATAAIAPDRCLAVVPCAAMTDMRHQPARATMSAPHTHAVWDAPDRDAAIAAAVASHGPHGELLLGPSIGPVLAPSDVELFQDPAWSEPAMAGFPAMFAHGLEGYADDRIADGGGWVEFDVGAITAPVTVLHGDADRMVDVVHARHTASIVPGAQLQVVPGAGHFSIERHVVAAVASTLHR